ncbi:MAG: hypothetical protein KF819_11825 [Labilithrix sp.]|nr:hypothetical protein [Labilithrix sp.]
MWPRRGLSRVALIVAFALGSPIFGCILFVSPEPLGEHCGFSGKEADCGKCVAARCQGEVDACCRDDACTSTLVSLEGCASARDDRCSAVRDARGTGGAAGALATCVASRCGGVCTKSSGASETRCAEPSLIKGRGCTCELGAPGTDFACNTEAFPETVCCAPQGWPGAGLACSCLPIGCLPSNDGCLCTRIDYEGPGATCAGAICCAESDGCYCGTKQCQSSQPRVPSCTLAEIGCPRGQKRVASCSEL